MNKTKTINAIRAVLSGIDDSLEDDDKLAMVKGYWEAGRLAVEYKRSTGMLIREIAKEVEIPNAVLQRYMQFFSAFPQGYPEKYYGRVISWTHICCVLPVRQAKARDFYLREACRHGWNKYVLTRRIREDYFGITREAAASRKPSLLKPKIQQLYTYAAEVIKVVDGDTMDLEIDVGFKTKQEHRVRLRGIDCPETGTPKGNKAKRFVEKEFARCIIKRPAFKGSRAARPVAVVKTFKQGMFGRYIVDLYYLPGETNTEIIAEKGKLLNQVMINEGMAQKI